MYMYLSPHSQITTLPQLVDYLARNIGLPSCSRAEIWHEIQ